MTLRPIKRSLKWALRQPWVWRTVRASMGLRGVAVLTYHRIVENGLFGGASAGAFESQMRWISKYCRPIAAQELTRAVDDSSSARPPVLVTFDDGFRDFHDVALPILERYEVPALVLLPTSLIGSSELLWTDRVTWLLANSTRDRLVLASLDGLDLSFNSPQDRTEASIRVKAELKVMPDVQRQETIRQLERACQVRAAPPERQFMTWDEVRACRHMAVFGGHSHTHPILSRVEDRQLEEEVRRCVELIESEVGYKPEFFAYPNGRKIDFDERARQALTTAGFTTAFTTEPGWCDGSDWLAVTRIPNGEARNVSDFVWMMTHPERYS